MSAHHWQRLPPELAICIAAAAELTSTLRLARTCHLLWRVLGKDPRLWRRVYMEYWQPCNRESDWWAWATTIDQCNLQLGTEVSTHSPSVADWHTLVQKRVYADAARRAARPLHTWTVHLAQPHGITWYTEVVAQSAWGMVCKSRPGYRLMVVPMAVPAAGQLEGHSMYELLLSGQSVKNSTIVAMNEQFIVVGVEVHEHGYDVIYHAWRIPAQEPCQSLAGQGLQWIDGCYEISGRWYLHMADVLLVWNIETGQHWRIDLLDNYISCWAVFLDTNARHAQLYMGTILPDDENQDSIPVNSGSSLENTPHQPDVVSYDWRVWHISPNDTTVCKGNGMPRHHPQQDAMLDGLLTPSLSEHGQFGVGDPCNYRIAMARMTKRKVLVAFTPRYGLGPWWIRLHSLDQQRLLWQKNVGKAHLPIPLPCYSKLILVPTPYTGRWREYSLQDGTERRAYNGAPPWPVFVEILRGMTTHTALRKLWHYSIGPRMIRELATRLDISITTLCGRISMAATATHVILADRGCVHIASFLPADDQASDYQTCWGDPVDLT
ncbi:hypothetical protein THASP1DRAFT_31986 [Thamnocephalis sphaerospora]|uniref:F-box domain-containing protein n=1 Tax=Thamnocephalis sphaerospora TaxID=78915 RepID=A0A4P9XK73_9FUNG|nr:hypothetical protein THASP1DRAFT_31986 [Thamnocephalis sphaerospora]|eukprot:RKP06198.1 hypothetical protein THASP1DRAFT_31986 [Thamnocephalis sphaerospora]